MVITRPRMTKNAQLFYADAWATAIRIYRVPSRLHLYGSSGMAIDPGQPLGAEVGIIWSYVRLHESLIREKLLTSEDYNLSKPACVRAHVNHSPRAGSRAISSSKKAEPVFRA